MKIVPFEMERWQSTWENRVEFNLSESGVQPIPLRELLGDPAAAERFLDHPLAYSQGNGTPELRAAIAAMYGDATPDHVLVTNGSSEANFLAIWHLVEPGDEVVVMLPNYMEIWGLVQNFRGTVRPLRLREDRRWQFDPADLAGVVTKKTKAIAVCNPNNPTGAIMASEARRAILGRTRSILQRNYAIVRDWIDEHGPLFSHIPPAAGAICYLRYALDINSSDLAERLLKQKSTLIVPGDHFGMDGYVRIGMGDAKSYVSGGLRRIDELLRELKAGRGTR